MYTISEKFENYLLARNRRFLVKASVNGVEYGNDKIVDFSIKTSITTSEEFELGSVVASQLTLKIKTLSSVPANALIVPYIAMTGSTGPTEWLPLGHFYVDTREKNGGVQTFVCLDKLMWSNESYISGISYPATMKQVWDEICDSLDYSYDLSVQIDPTYMIQAGPAGFTKKQVMGYIASANAACIYADKNGVIKFRRFAAADTPSFTMETSDYFRAKLLNPPKSFTRVVVTYDTDDGLTYEAGAGDENHTLHIDNPFATQEIANDLNARLNGFGYMPVEIEARGYPQLEAGDAFNFSNVVNSPAWIQADVAWDEADFPWNGLDDYVTVALNVDYAFAGGLKIVIESPSKSEQESEFKVEGPLTQSVNRLNQNAVKFDKPYYGVIHSRTEGIIVEREDHKSKVILNSDKLEFQANGVRKLYFDPPTEQFKFTGVVEASSFVGGNIVIGSGNSVFKADGNGIWAGHANFASAPFRVNMAGHMVAVGAEFSGTITASVITGVQINGSTITGSLIQTSASYPNSVMSSSGNFFKASANANQHVAVLPFFAGNGAPEIEFTDGISGGGAEIFLNPNNGQLNVMSDKSIRLYSSLGIIRLNSLTEVLNWASLYSGATGQTLEQALNNLSSSISGLTVALTGKATKDINTGESATLNAGIAIGTRLAVWGSGNVVSGYVTWNGVSPHTHPQK